MRHLFAGVCALSLLIGCGTTPEPAEEADPAAEGTTEGATPEGAEAPPDEGTNPTDSVGAQATAANDSTCPQGYWEAADFLEAIRTQIKEQGGGLGEATITRGDGAMVFRITEDQLAVRARDLTHEIETATRGIRASATHIINGETTLPASFPADGEMQVEPATEGELRTRLRLRTSIGINLNRGLRVPMDMSGAFSFECGADGQSMVVDRSDMDTDTQPIRLNRTDEEAWNNAEPAEEPPEEEQEEPTGLGGALQGLTGLREAAEAIQRASQMAE